MERLETLLQEVFPHAIEFSVFDRTGTGDHFQVVVGTIHELRIKTKGSR
jgi:hypothetical protein